MLRAADEKSTVLVLSAEEGDAELAANALGQENIRAIICADLVE